MGRSQVLYNRTKGRNKNRPGRGGNRTNEESSSVNRRKDSGYINKPREQFQPSSSINRQTPKDYEHEYEVLFAGRTTYLSSSKTRGDDNDDNENFLLGGSTNGSICIPSMAATLESMEISKRLRIPMRVAAKAFPERFRMAQEEEREMESPRETTVGDSNIETNKTASNGSSSDLEDWLDDACGIVDEDKEETSTTSMQRKNMPMDEPKNKETSTIQKDDTIGTMNAVAGNALAQAEEDCGDDNLDDWLDSVIE